MDRGTVGAETSGIGRLEMWPHGYGYCDIMQRHMGAAAASRTLPDTS